MSDSTGETTTAEEGQSLFLNGIIFSLLHGVKGSCKYLNILHVPTPLKFSLQMQLWPAWLVCSVQSDLNFGLSEAHLSKLCNIRSHLSVTCDSSKNWTEDSGCDSVAEI